jgi:hypothetical protein
MASQSSGSWAKYGAYAAAWKYLIYVLIMKEIAARRVRLPKGTGAQSHSALPSRACRPRRPGLLGRSIRRHSWRRIISVRD